MLNQILNNYTLQIVLLGTLFLGIVCGIVGVFLTLKKEALVGDALSHAALPGVVIAYMITNKSSLIVSIIGAIFAAIVALFLIEIAKRYSKIKSDAILAIILSSLFGLGQVLLSVIRDTAGQEQARLNKFIFGQAATMSPTDVYFLLAILLFVLIVVILFYRHFKLFIFNSEYYVSLGFSKMLITIILNSLTILVVVAGIQAVGVILMSSLLIAPAVAARLLSNKLKVNLILASFFGGLTGVLGTLYGTNLATGPVIVIFATSIVLLTLLFAPNNGIIWVKVSNKIYIKNYNKYHSLLHIFEGDTKVTLTSEESKHYINNNLIEINENNEYTITKEGIKIVSKIMVGGKS